MKFLLLLALSCSFNNTVVNKPITQSVPEEKNYIDLIYYKEKSKNSKISHANSSDEEENIHEENEEELISLIDQLQTEQEKNFFELGKKAPTPARYFILPFGGRISSRYGLRKGKMHHGIDIPGPIGAKLKASNHGKVVFSGYKNGYGQLVIISHLPNIYTVYAHTSKNIVKTGMIVKKGDTVALLGNTGRSTGPHVHFEIRKGSKSVDPIEFIKNQRK